MRPPSPDARWEAPGFWLRRLAGLPDRAEAPQPAPEALDRAAARVARARRGSRLRCAFLLAPLPRSGTNFAEALIAAHPATATSPLGLREAAFLAEAPRLAPFAAALARRHESAAAIGAEEWLGYALAGALARTADERPEARLALFKDPRARGLERLRAALPDAVPVIVLRDGRRTLDSHLRTWPPRLLGRSWADRCAEWARGVQAALDLARRDRRAIVVRYEAAAADPPAAAAGLWRGLGLPPAPAEGLGELPVLGSSIHSRGTEGVDWRPRARPADFDPAGRRVDWPAWRERVFLAVAGEAQARLDREAPAKPGVVQRVEARAG